MRVSPFIYFMQPVFSIVLSCCLEQKEEEEEEGILWMFIRFVLFVIHVLSVFLAVLYCFIFAYLILPIMLYILVKP